MVEPDLLCASSVPGYVRAVVPVLGRADVGRLAHWVHDADEETSGLYSRPASGREGLGQLPVASDLLYVHIARPPGPVRGAPAGADDTSGPGEFVISPGVTARAGTSEEREEVQALLAGPPRGPAAPRAPPRPSARSRSRAKGRAQALVPAAFAALFLQNQTHLRSHAGDTGSVVWRSTVKLAATLARRRGADALLHLQHGMRVVEVGAGTGALAVLLAAARIAGPGAAGPAPEDGPAEQLTWLATDQDALLPLLRKNAVLANALGPDSGLKVLPQALDWTEALDLAPSQLGRYQRAVLSSFPPVSGGESDGEPHGADLLLAVDVVYNEHLFRPLLATLTALCTPGRTVAVVLLELRQADMVGEFIAQWLAWDTGPDGGGAWHIVSMDPEALGGAGLQEDYALFVAWRTSSS